MPADGADRRARAAAVHGHQGLPLAQPQAAAAGEQQAAADGGAAVKVHGPHRDVLQFQRGVGQFFFIVKSKHFHIPRTKDINSC